MPDTSFEPPLTFFGSGQENAALSKEIAELTVQVLTSGQILNGPEVFALEARVAAQIGRKHAVAVNSATDGLFFSMAGLGVAPGDDVLVTAFSFVASASGIMRLGANPVFADVEGPSADMPVAMSLSDASRRLTPKTRAMIWVDLFGGVSDPEPVRAFAKDKGLILIEDASQAFGASFNGAQAGQLGDTAVFSFDRNKVIGADGTAGMVVTDDDEVAARLRSVRYHGVGKNGFERLGYNSQMSSLTAGILNLKLNHHPGWIARRRDIARHFDEGFADLPLKPLSWPDAVGHVWHKYVVLSEERAALEAHLHDCGVPCRQHYGKALADEPAFDGVGSSCPEATNIAATALSLPIHAFLSDIQVAQIIGAVRAFYGR